MGESDNPSLRDEEEVSMYTMLRSISVRSALAQQAPTAVASMIIAELFFKFRSFTLECLAFLATWCILDATVAAARRVWRSRATAQSAALR
jgi:hypothetical protein